MISSKKAIAVAINLLLYFTVQSQIDFSQFNQDVYAFEEVRSEVLLNHIDHVADSARIIGLGEVSHYTKECYTIKHAIIEKLIAKGFDALILEVDFGQALLWNEYVLNGEGDIDSLISDSGWFTYRTQEFKDLLLSIREHNKTAEKPFQVFGMEMTAINHNLEWLSQYCSKKLGDSHSIIDQLKAERKSVAFMSHSPQEVQDYWKLYFDLYTALGAGETPFHENEMERDHEIAMRMLEILRQYATYISQDEFYLQVELRDQFSFRNVLWCMDMFGINSKVAIWAHNGHVVKKSVLFDYDILGYYLSDTFQSQYYSIGFTFNEGEFGAFSSGGFQKFKVPRVEEASLTKFFGELGGAFAMFDVRNAMAPYDHPACSPLNRRISTRRDISESYNPDSQSTMLINLSISYDCVIYIDQTHFPTTIEWTR